MNRLGHFLLFLLALLVAAPAAAQKRAAYGRAPGRRDRVGGARLDGHPRLRDAAAARLARLLAQSGRRRRRSRGCAGGCPRAGAPGRSQYPVPDRLIVAGPDELCLRARLCLARRRCSVPADGRARRRPSRSTRGSTIWSAPTRSACPRPRPSRPSSPSARRGDRNPAFAPTARRCRGRSAREARFEVAGGRLRLAVPLPRATARRRSLFLPGDARRARAIREPQTHLAQRRHADRRDRGRARGRPSSQAIEGVLEIAPGIGLALTARPGAVPAAGTPVAGPARRRPRCEGPGLLRRSARRAARRADPQHHALRLPDPQPQGAEPRPRRRDRERGAARGAGLCGAA